MNVRASISRDEWTALRKIALDRNTSTQTLVAEALRAAFTLSPNGDTSDDR